VEIYICTPVCLQGVDKDKFTLKFNSGYAYNLQVSQCIRHQYELIFLQTFTVSTLHIVLNINYIFSEIFLANDLNAVRMNTVSLRTSCNTYAIALHYCLTNIKRHGRKILQFRKQLSTRDRTESQKIRFNTSIFCDNITN
jgi:hypothetical protein